ncbi:MAG TPA: hypothetical protein VE111_03200 [Bradyrhizobium sp.]|nr:hypothetical protein [Bradyrhizobium sp.]
MPRLKLKIDLDIDFSVAATFEAFGFEAVVGIRRKVARQGVAKLAKGETVELTPDEYSELVPEKDTALDQ